MSKLRVPGAVPALRASQHPRSHHVASSHCASCPRSLSRQRPRAEGGAPQPSIPEPDPARRMTAGPFQRHSCLKRGPLLGTRGQTCCAGVPARRTAGTPAPLPCPPLAVPGAPEEGRVRATRWRRRRVGASSFETEFQSPSLLLWSKLDAHQEVRAWKEPPRSSGSFLSPAVESSLTAEDQGLCRVRPPALSRAAARGAQRGGATPALPVARAPRALRLLDGRPPGSGRSHFCLGRGFTQALGGRETEAAARPVIGRRSRGRGRHWAKAKWETGFVRVRGRGSLVRQRGQGSRACLGYRRGF